MKSTHYLIIAIYLLAALPFARTINVEASNPSIPVKVAVPSFANLTNLDDFIRDDHLPGVPALPYLSALGAVMTNAGGQTSSLFTKTQMAKANPTSPGFSTYFVIDIYKTNSGLPADGYVFTLANNTSTLGSTGGGLGYEGVPNSVGVIFDYFKNNASEVVASTDVFTNGVLTSRTGSGFDASFLTVWNNTPLNQKVRSMHTWIEYNSSTASIEIRVAPNNATRPATATRIQTNLTLNQISEFYYAGFSAATGGSSMSVVLNQWYFASEYIAGGINLNTQSYIVDNTPPTEPVISTQSEAGQYTFSVDGGTDDNGISAYQVKKPGGNWITYQSPVVMDTLGIYEARSVDTVGNFSISNAQIGLWQVQFFGHNGLLKTIKMLSNEVYDIQEQLIDDTFRYDTWLYNQQPIQKIEYPTQSLQLFGQGVRYVFELEFDLNGGTPLSVLPVNYSMGSNWESPQVSLEGHRFAGWFLDDDLTVPFEETSIDLTSPTIQLFAQWTANTYQISFNTMEGTELDDMNVVYGTSISLPPTPSKVGYTFAGWYEDEFYTEPVIVPSTMPAHDLTWYAQWVINTHTVTFLDVQGNIITTFSRDYGMALDTIPSPLQPGYRWIGWSFQALLVDFTTFTMPDHAVIFTPIFEGLTVTINFITYEGTLVIQATSGQALGLLPVLPVYNGYRFVGWSLIPLDATQLIDETYVVPNVETLMLFPIWNESNLSIQPTKFNDLNIESSFHVGPVITVLSLSFLFIVYLIKVLKEESIYG